MYRYLFHNCDGLGAHICAAIVDPLRSSKELRGSKAFTTATCSWPNRAMYFIPIKIQGKVVPQLCKLSLKLWPEWDYSRAASSLFTILFCLQFLHGEPGNNPGICLLHNSKNCISNDPREASVRDGLWCFENPDYWKHIYRSVRPNTAIQEASQHAT